MADRPRCTPPALPAPVGDGLLIVDKPVGPTSHDLVQAVRRWTGRREVGHAGTLDPGASGVLLILLGEATKLSAHLTLDDKRYRVQVELGTGTDTGDAEGLATATVPLAPGWLSRSALEDALEGERARVAQVPPAHSAIKIAGRAAHRLTRAGRPPELGPRPVSVRSLQLWAADDRSLDLELVVSKGYFVRSFARDLGHRLGVPAHVRALRRLASGPFTLDEAVPWPPVARVAPLPLAAVARRALPTVTLTAAGEALARQGRRLALEHFAVPPPADSPPSHPAVVAWLSQQGELVALGRAAGSDEFRVARGFRSPRSRPAPGREPPPPER